MKRVLLVGCALLTVGALVAVAQTRTPRHKFDYTDQEALNRDLERLDQRVVGTATQGSFVVCGQLTNGASSTVSYLGPVEVQDGTAAGEGLQGPIDAGSTVCDAADSTTEATADAPVFTSLPLRITGMYCRAVAAAGTTGSGNAGVIFTLRSAAAALSPSVTCTVPTTGIDCYASGLHDSSGVVYSNLPAVAAGATVAVLATIDAADDLSAMDGWCRVFYTMETR